jgi:hypothetical protein
MPPSKAIAERFCKRLLLSSLRSIEREVNHQSDSQDSERKRDIII